MADPAITRSVQQDDQDGEERANAIGRAAHAAASMTSDELLEEDSDGTPPVRHPLA